MTTSDSVTLSGATPTDGTLQIDGKRHKLTILDGHGGMLALDVSSPDAQALGVACEHLLASAPLSGASMLKVSAAGHVYLVSRRVSADDEVAISIRNLFDPSEHVLLM